MHWPTLLTARTQSISFAFLDQVHPTGKTFSVSDGEGKSATVELNEPVSTAIIYGISLPTRFRVSGGTKYVVQLVSCLLVPLLLLVIFSA